MKNNGGNDNDDNNNKNITNAAFSRGEATIKRISFFYFLFSSIV